MWGSVCRSTDPQNNTRSLLNLEVRAFPVTVDFGRADGKAVSALR